MIDLRAVLDQEAVDAGELVGTLASFVGEEARLERGQRLDARAYLLIRGWVDPVIKVELLDVNDPAPYWLISTRRPDAVAAAIERARVHPSANAAGSNAAGS